MNFQTAARIQYRRHSKYVVTLKGPNGEQEAIGYTARKSGSGLLAILYTPRCQERVKQLPGADSARLTKTATALVFSNGWRMEFGGTILQEAE